MNKAQKDYQLAFEHLRWELGNAEDLIIAVLKVYLYAPSAYNPVSRDCKISDSDAAKLVVERLPQYKQEEVKAAIERFRETASAEVNSELSSYERIQCAGKELADTFKLLPGN